MEIGRASAPIAGTKRPTARDTETLAPLLSLSPLSVARWRLEDPAERTTPEDFPPATGDEPMAGEPFPIYSPLFLSLYSLPPTVIEPREEEDPTVLSASSCRPWWSGGALVGTAAGGEPVPPKGIISFRRW
jgi:hypothetical protein